MSAQPCATNSCPGTSACTDSHACTKRSAMPSYALCETCESHLNDRTPEGWCNWVGGYSEACSGSQAWCEYNGGWYAVTVCCCS